MTLGCQEASGIVSPSPTNTTKQAKQKEQIPEMEMMMLSLTQMPGTTTKAGSDRTIVGRIWDAVMEARRRAEARAAVANLLDQDDRMLRDIGVTREDVIEALKMSGGEDPASYLARIRKQRIDATRIGLIKI